MIPTHQQDQADAARTIRTDIDLALERRANARGEMRLTDDDLAAVVRTAELLGCDVAAERIRAAARRRAGRAELRAVPDVGGRRRASTPNRPILVALDGSGERIAPAEGVDASEAMVGELADFAARWLEADLPADEIRMLARIAQACAARHRRRPRPLRPLPD